MSVFESEVCKDCGREADDCLCVHEDQGSLFDLPGEPEQSPGAYRE